MKIKSFLSEPVGKGKEKQSALLFTHVDGEFIPFSRMSLLCEMQTAASTI